MRKTGFLVFSIFVFFSILLPQTIIKNPEKPLSKNAGRVLKLQEVLRITDESGDFYFKYPRDFMVAYDGSIFFRQDLFLNHMNKGGSYEVSGWRFFRSQKLWS